MLRLVSCIDFFSVNKCYNYFVVKKVIIGLRVSTIAVLVFILSKLLKLIIHHGSLEGPTNAAVKQNHPTIIAQRIPYFFGIHGVRCTLHIRRKILLIPASHGLELFLKCKKW